MTGVLPPSKPVRCIKCSIAVTVEHNRQMHEKRGPAWERWKAAMANFAARELADQPTPPEP